MHINHREGSLQRGGLTSQRVVDLYYLIRGPLECLSVRCSSQPHSSRYAYMILRERHGHDWPTLCPPTGPHHMARDFAEGNVPMGRSRARLFGEAVRLSRTGAGATDFIKQPTTCMIA